MNDTENMYEPLSKKIRNHNKERIDKEERKLQDN